jgi:phosphoglucosamine mutase
VTVLGDAPDGVNITAGVGAPGPGPLLVGVVATGAPVGLALDGDADRVIAVDHRGEIVDGDHLIAVCALDLAERGRLRGRTVVVTVMTNLGFKLGMAEHGIDVVETPVGDRHVLEAMEAGPWSLGGEQSGHVVFADLATTGDGVLTGLQVLDLVRRRGRTLADLAGGAMTRLPQVLRNVPVAGTAEAVVAAVAGEVAAVEAGLGERGRVLIRRSGTEPLVRVMVEAPTAAEAEEAVGRLVGAVEAAGRRAAGPSRAGLPGRGPGGVRR